MRTKTKRLLILFAVLKKALLLAFLTGWFTSESQTPIVTFYDSTNTLVKEKYFILNNDSSQVDGNYQMFGKFAHMFIPFKSPIAIQFFSHKFLRVLIPIFMIALFVMNIS